MQVSKDDSVYKVSFGSDRPAEAILGHLEPGMSTIKGSSVQAPPISGLCVIPNIGFSWGRRVVKDAKGSISKKENVDVNDTDYKGYIDWLPHGHKDGTLIQYRWVAGQRSLDYQFQITRLRLPDVNADPANAYLSFPYGVSEFYPELDPALVELLKIHYANENSESKPSNATCNVTFREIKRVDKTKEDVAEMEKTFEAYSLVKAAENFDDLKVLKIVLDKNQDLIKYTEKDETSLYSALSAYAKNNPDDFMDKVNEYRKNVSDFIEKAKSFKLIDVTKDNQITFGSGASAIKIEAEGKGEALYHWLFSNSLKKEVFETIEKANLLLKK